MPPSTPRPPTLIAAIDPARILRSCCLDAISTKRVSSSRPPLTALRRSSKSPMAQQQQPESDASPRVYHVEQAWLDAARRGDVDQMKLLRKQHPRWLDLNRKVDDAVDEVSEGDSDGSRSSRTAGFCSWSGFHLSSIGASALHTATWHGDDKIVKYLLEEGQDPDTQDEAGMTAIMLVIMHHNLQATRCIFRDREAVQRNLLIDCRQEDEERTRSSIDRIRIFLCFHADVDKHCQRGKTALHYATTDDTYEVARLLISSGASVDAQDEEGRSPLYDSIQSSSLLVTNLLVHNGANIHLPAKDGVTPLQLAIRTHDVNTLQIILNHHRPVSTNQGEDFAVSVVMTAIDEGAVPVVEFLLDEGYVHVDHRNASGETPMHRALLKQRADIAALLRAFDEHGEVLVLGTTTDESCLHYAARYSFPEELHRLLAFYRQRRDDTRPGTDDAVTELLNSVNSNGNTALFVAATSDSDSVEIRDSKTRLMMESGAMLLGSSPFLETTSPQESSIMLLSPEVQTCLSLWFSECAGACLDDVTKFCIDYLAIISASHEHQLPVSHDVLGVLLSSGQAVDVAPLLLLLPFDRRASLALLEHVRTFGREHNHSLILALSEELAAAWTGLAA